MRLNPALLSLCLAVPAAAQWTLQDAHTQANLRGIHALSPQTAWASGDRGTVLRTTDGGAHWQACPIPPNAQKLDFRAIQGIDENTAVVMSAGPGDQSRVFRTTDACATWQQVFANPDTPDGFFDVLALKGSTGLIVGDPVKDHFATFETADAGQTWHRLDGPAAVANEGLFAASNTSLTYTSAGPIIVTGGAATNLRTIAPDPKATPLPIQHNEAAGAFSVATGPSDTLVIVGGDYKHPDDTTNTAAYSTDNGEHWQLSATMPHGYRSAVAYDPATKSWIATGPNGSDVSKDNGQHWSPLEGDTARNWNALSLPFAVGPKGRVGRLMTSSAK